MQRTKAYTMLYTNSWKAWVLAARPKTLMAAVVPVMIAAAFCFYDHSGRQGTWIPLLLCFLFAVIMQIDANFVNDYFDNLHGNDSPATRLGPPRACAEGWVTPRAMRNAIIATTAFASIIGLLTVLCYGNIYFILIGIACVAGCFLYTLWFSYHAMGDVLVVLFFGIVPVCGTYYLATGIALPTHIVIASIACGMMIDALLLVNNFRDCDVDRANGKYTLVVYTGRTWGGRLNMMAGWLSALLMLMAIVMQPISIIALTAVLLLFAPFVCMHTATALQLPKAQGKDAYNRILAHTARNIFLFGLTTITALAVAGITNSVL